MRYKLSEIMFLIGGGTPKTTMPEYWNGDIPWLSVKDFNNDNRYVYTTEKSITQKGLENSSARLLIKDDTIISARGTVGEIAMIPFPMAFNQSCYGLRAKQNIVDIDSRRIICKPGCVLSIGDVLLSLTGNVGRVGIVCEEKLLLNQRVAKFIPKDPNILPLLYYYFRLPSSKVTLESIAKGTAQQNLSPVETLKLQVPFESSTALDLSKTLQPMFTQEIAGSMESIRLAAIRDALLPKLMSGELDVSDVEL